jgi:uncharacterized membrane protein
MAATSHGTNQASGSRQSMRYQEPTAWAGWVVFGGTLLILMGAFQVVQGLVAVFDDGFYLVSPSGLVVDVNYNTWGWAHVVIGLVALLAGLGLMAGNIVARTVGVIVAMVSAIVNMAFVAAYPVWSLMVIGLDVLVIYAIIAHGRELKD